MHLFSLLEGRKVQLTKGKVIPAEQFTELLSAQEIIEETKEEQKNHHKQMEEEKERTIKIAKEEGFQEGLEKFNEHLYFFNAKLKSLQIEMQTAMLPLVLKATKKILGETMSLNPELITEIVIQSIKSVSTCKVVKILLHKQDIEFIENQKETIKEHLENLETLEIEERADLQRGDCMIQTEKGVLNATLENQFRALERAFENHQKR